MSLARIGINIAAGTGYDCASLRFTDVMLMSSGWFDPSGTHPFTADSAGWPNSAIDSAFPPQNILALNAIMPVGTYPVTADGIGTVQIGATGVSGYQDCVFDGSGTPRSIQCAAPGGEGIQWLARLTASNTSNHLRNIKVRLPGATSSIFNPDFKALLEPFDYIRFMEWMGTNSCPFVEWADRVAAKQYFTVNEQGSTSYEACIALANEMGKDPWVCIPHMASDDYVVQMAQLWDQGLDPGLKLYVEYSNECWNFGFGQWSWHVAQASNPTAPPFIQCNGNAFGLIGLRMGHTLKLFKDTITSGREVIRIVGGQSGGFGGPTRGFTDTIEGYAGQLGYGYEAVATAPYLGTTSEVIEPAGVVYGSDPTTALNTLFAAFPAYTTAILAETKLHTDYYLARGKQVYFYECGQGLVSSPTAGPLLVAAQFDARMGAAYVDWLDRTNAQGGVTGLSYYHDCGPWGASGLWGHRLNTYSNPAGIKWTTIVAQAQEANSGITPPPPPPLTTSRPRRFGPLRRLRPFR